ncbi:MAG: ZIP family metal transporter [Candidatus Dojkabacteria bacterium]|nr:ZIP family metal transporter [Candidatus Dojkabacteria bacterium]MDQ7021079.1 ZIP family metal transporter [Candidatus Dojkabacteria bacterium]
MGTFLQIILVTFIVSSISLVGALTLSLSHKFLNKIIIFLVSLAAGSLIGDVFFHIIPEIVETDGEFKKEIALMMLFGIVSFLSLEKLLHWHHCHNETTTDHPHPVAVNNLIADGLHNFIDGMIIAASFTASTEIGIATTIAVIAHEIPQEIGDFGVLVHSGFSRSKAVFFNFVSALFAIVGALLAYFSDSKLEGSANYLLAFAAGSFLYIAIADLFPEIKHESDFKKNLLQVLFVLIGIGIMYGLLFVEA